MLAGIMAISRSRPTVSQLMKTCYTLYIEGPKHLLRGGVQLASADEITKFARFMLTEDSSRFAYLRKLVLLTPPLLHPDHQIRSRRIFSSSSTWYTGPDAHLFQLLSHSSLVLEALELRPTKTPLGRITNLIGHGAISGLMTVNHLVVVGVDQYTAASISRLPWRLESISIGVEDGVRGILPMLTRFSDTLQTLLLKSESCDLYYLFGLNPGACHFPHVRTFGIVHNKPISGLLSRSGFADAFPAITHIQLIPSYPPTTPRSRIPFRTHSTHD